MKLEVGMYARLRNGYCDELGIGKISFVAVPRLATINFKNRKLGVFVEDIKRASFNIIDLIEEGDYINGLRVEKNKYGELYTSYVYYGGDIGKQYEVYTTWLKGLKKDMIYSITTHEQIEQMAYKAGE